MVRTGLFPTTVRSIRDELHPRIVAVRWVLEAAILARAPIAEAAGFCGVSEGAARLYASVFFDVAGKLDSPSWIMSRLPLLGVGIASVDLDTTYKIIGYTAGWTVLRDYIGFAKTNPALRQELTKMIPQVGEHRRLQAFPPQRPPEPLHLAQGLRPAGRRHDLPDAPLLQFLAELALAPPSDVLAAVVGEDLLGGPVGRDRRPKHLQHQRGRLAGVQAVADDEPAVVVHEGDQVDPPVLPLEHEGEQVGLPKLVGTRRMGGPPVHRQPDDQRPRRHCGGQTRLPQPSLPGAGRWVL